jgi:hypothetical protein
MNHESSLQLGAPVNRFLQSPVNWLVAFVPISVALEHSGNVAAPVLLFSAALAG